MLNFDGDVDANADANVKCEHTFSLGEKHCWFPFSFKIRSRKSVISVSLKEKIIVGKRTN